MVAVSSGVGSARPFWRVMRGDINRAALAQTVKELHTFTPKGCGFCLDVAHTPTVIATAHKVKDPLGTVDILINNAGIVVEKEFRDHSHRVKGYES